MDREKELEHNIIILEHKLQVLRNVIKGMCGDMNSAISMTTMPIVQDALKEEAT